MGADSNTDFAPIRLCLTFQPKSVVQQRRWQTPLTAGTPWHHQMAQQYQALMAAPPESHDGEIVSMTRAEDRP